MLKPIAIYAPDLTTRYKLPISLGRLPAGFPSPADDYLEGKLDITKHLVKHHAATFYVRVSGDSMIWASIHSRDLLVVDRSLEPKNGNVIVAALDGDLTVKCLYQRPLTAAPRPLPPAGMNFPLPPSRSSPRQYSYDPQGRDKRLMPSSAATL
ncbi:MAG TPA: translesion error-prone DNA polymerase V autoproteolytic subunit [Nitrospira sp.]|nr:translesion error-prone DNA polymerase V autoproteolytic subunit [Nitrospira sp.]